MCRHFVHGSESLQSGNLYDTGNKEDVICGDLAVYGIFFVSGSDGDFYILTFCKKQGRTAKNIRCHKKGDNMMITIPITKTMAPSVLIYDKSDSDGSSALLNKCNFQTR